MATKKTLTFALMDPPYESANSTTAFRLLDIAILRCYRNGQPLSPSGGDASAELRLDWDGENLRADGSFLGLVAVDGGGALDRDAHVLRSLL